MKNDNELKKLIGLTIDEALLKAKSYGFSFIRKYHSEENHLSSDYCNDRLNIEYNKKTQVVVWAYFG